MADADAEKWMRAALAEAQKAWGLCHPNPMVGAVIAQDGELISTGYHHRAGEAHAEINALAGVPEGCKLDRATIYVTLEPCSTFGRTPPCCDAIIRAGIGRVVIGCLDANPQHAGAAVARLKAAGIAVETGICESECRRLNEHFFWWITHRRPWVILKLGMTLDGKIALPDGRSRWITGAASRARVQELRRFAGMIMVGGKTARLDNSSLRVTEPPDWQRQPLRAVWTTQALPEGLNLAQDAVRAKPATREEWLDFLRSWGEREISVLLLEGGGELAANALASGIVNQVQFFIAPKIMGGRGSTPAVGGNAPSELADMLRLRDCTCEFCGDDLLYTGYPENCE